MLLETTLGGGDACSDLVQGVLWSDPSEVVDGFVANDSRGGAGALFGKRAMREWLQRHGYKLLVRGHQVSPRISVHLTRAHHSSPHLTTSHRISPHLTTSHHTSPCFHDLLQPSQATRMRPSGRREGVGRL